MREVKPLELDKELKSIPDGVTGYVYAHSLSAASEYKNDFLRLKFVTANAKLRGENFVFQVKKISNETIVLIGFISDEANLSLANENDFQNSTTVVFPVPRNEFKNEVEIPLTSEVVVTDRNIEDETGASISILEIQKRKKTINDSQINSTKNGKYKGKNNTKTRKEWYREAWGQVSIGLFVLIFGTIILKLLKII